MERCKDRRTDERWTRLVSIEDRAVARAWQSFPILFVSSSQENALYRAACSNLRPVVGQRSEAPREPKQSHSVRQHPKRDLLVRRATLKDHCRPWKFQPHTAGFLD